MIRIVVALLATVALASPAAAHGTLPATNGLTFGPSDGAGGRGGFFFGTNFGGRGVKPIASCVTTTCP